MFEWVLNMPISLYVVIGVHIVAPKAIQVQPVLALNIFGTFWLNFPFQKQEILFCNRIIP